MKNKWGNKKRGFVCTGFARMGLAMLAGISALSPSAWAVPIVNENAGIRDSQILTAYPDQQDPNLYYIGTRMVGLAHDAAGRPLLSYQEIGGFLKHKGAIIKVMLSAQFPADELQKAIAAVTAVNPAARLATLPVTAARIVSTALDRHNNPLVEKVDCDHAAGSMDTLQSCTFYITGSGRNAVRQMLQAGIAFTVQYAYSFDGVERMPDGHFEAAKRDFEAGGYVGEPTLAKFPELFRDKNGNVLDAIGSGTKSDDPSVQACQALLNQHCAQPVIQAGGSCACPAL